MSVEQQEYVIAPWGEGECDTEILTIELPSRELVVQLETPRTVVDQMTTVGKYHGLTVEEALAERLEINRARVSLLAARGVDDVERVRDHLTEAREFLSGVETLDTEQVDAEIDELRDHELDRE